MISDVCVFSGIARNHGRTHLLGLYAVAGLSQCLCPHGLQTHVVVIAANGDQDLPPIEDRDALHLAVGSWPLDFYGTARLLKTGRTAVPVFAWISPLARLESEQGGGSINLSWVFYRDDEGRTWKRSESELVVGTPNHNAHGVYDFEEPCNEELRDVYMYGEM